MQLHVLRQHYSKKPGNKWVPKKAFKTPEEVKEILGFDPNLCKIYDCTVCGLLHVSAIRK